MDIIDDRIDFVQHGLFLLRQRAMKQLLAVMEERDAGVLGAMILGEKTYLPADRKGQFQKAGIGWRYRDFMCPCWVPVCSFFCAVTAFP